MKTPTMDYERSLLNNHSLAFETYIKATISDFEKRQTLRNVYNKSVTRSTIRSVFNIPIKLFVQSLKAQLIAN